MITFFIILFIHDFSDVFRIETALICVFDFFNSDNILSRSFCFSDSFFSFGTVLEWTSEDSVTLLLHSFNSFLIIIDNKVFRSFNYLNYIIFWFDFFTLLKFNYYFELWLIVMDNFQMIIFQLVLSYTEAF